MKSSTSRRLIISHQLHQAMIDHALAESPIECCGLLAGKDETTHHFPLVNALASPTRFESDPVSMFKAIRQMRQLGIDMTGIYHSHPTSPAVPSRHDRDCNEPGDLLHIIISLVADPIARCWRLNENGWEELELVVLEA